MARHTLSTILCWTDKAGEDRETCAVVEYTTYAGFCGSMEQPPEDASVEIQTVTVTSGHPLDDRDWTDDDELRAECMQDWIDDCEAAAEYRADARRADAIMERF